MAGFAFSSYVDRSIAGWLSGGATRMFLRGRGWSMSTF
ncbi:hypothetical protein AM1_G0017 (plasmid) [Acaryochloris marina MBIC11017]|uniref:Uncharacterized protein n=1 Tax=Acaryochloris marina (strain MBIC 11017) TaxID=329726 RepID=A8ZQB1_ACAM1|nr:hypothetical protein AM1_G0017 [Acaryochloris marina MBIC11017]